MNVILFHTCIIICLTMSGNLQLNFVCHCISPKSYGALQQHLLRKIPSTYLDKQHDIPLIQANKKLHQMTPDLDYNNRHFQVSLKNLTKYCNRSPSAGQSATQKVYFFCPHFIQQFSITTQKAGLLLCYPW